MKIFYIKYALLIFFACTAINPIRALDPFEVENCCLSHCYECTCEPLYCGSIGLMVQAGIRPIIWRNRGTIYGVNCVTPPASGPVTVIQELPSFHHFYRLPWQVGAQLSYAFSCNTNVFVEFNYAQAKSKRNCSASSSATGFQCSATAVNGLALKLGKYKLYDAYVGVNYYCNRWCDRVAFFFGGKVGLLHHNNVKYYSLTSGFSCTTGATTVFCDTAAKFFKSNTVIAGGAQAGFDICFCGNWSLVVTGNVIASCGPRAAAPIALNTTEMLNLNGASSLIPSGVGTELAFPITVGIKYNF